MTRDDTLSDSDSFKSFDDDTESAGKKKADVTSPIAKNGERFSPHEEQKLLEQSNDEKKTGNTLFGKGSYENAVQSYERALSSLPNYLDYELAVLRSNIAACHIKLEEWKQAVDSASKGIDSLNQLEPLPELPQVDPRKEETAKSVEATTVEEVDDLVIERIERLKLSGRTLQEIRLLQTKLLLRRAKARASLGGWADLQAADEDYRILLSPSMEALLTASDRKTTTEAQRALAPRLNAAREKEVAEMMGKLKGLGNTLLKPFGMSTDNFQFVKDEKSGGYSMNFQQNPGRS